MIDWRVFKGDDTECVYRILEEELGADPEGRGVFVEYFSKPFSYGHHRIFSELGSLGAVDVDDYGRMRVVLPIDQRTPRRMLCIRRANGRLKGFRAGRVPERTLRQSP